MELCTLYVRGEKGGREMAYLAQQGTGPEEDCNCEGGKGRPAAIDRHHPGPGRGNRERAGGTGSGPGDLFLACEHLLYSTARTIWAAFGDGGRDREQVLPFPDG